MKLESVYVKAYKYCRNNVYIMYIMHKSLPTKKDFRWQKEGFTKE